MKSFCDWILAVLLCGVLIAWAMTSYEKMRDKRDGPDGWGGYV